MRYTGCAALDLAYVAAGRFDGFFHNHINLWDVAAGSLMVREAGGIVNDINKFSTKFSENKKFISIFDVPFRYPYDYSKYNSTNFIYKKKYLFNFYNKIAEKHKNDNYQNLMN